MSAYKVINIGNVGTAIKFGGNDLDLTHNLLNGQVASLPPVKIKSSAGFGFWDGKMYIRNQADTFKTTIRGQTNSVADFDLFLPPIVADDTLVSLNLSQIFPEMQQFDDGIRIKEKTIPIAPNLPTPMVHEFFFDSVDGRPKAVDSTGTVIDFLANTGPSHAINHALGGTDPFTKAMTVNSGARYVVEEATDPTSDSRRMWLNTNTKIIEYWDNQTSPVKQAIEVQSNKGIASGYCDLDTNVFVPIARLSGIGDAQIAAHTTSKITIANRALIPTGIAYEDEINIFTVAQKFDAGGVKIKPITVPGTDAAYGIIYSDSADLNKIKYKRPDGTVDNLSNASSAPTTSSYVVITNDATLTADRAIATGDGIALVDGGANSTVTIAHDVVDYARKHIHFIDEFFGDSATGGVNFQTSTSGTGSTVTNLGIAELSVYGGWQCATGTTTTGRAGLLSGNSNSFSLGQGPVVFEGKLRVATLSTAGEEFIVAIGFYDSTSNAPVDACRFVYNRLSSVNWQIQTTSNSVTTTNTSTTAVDTGWHRFKIEVNAAGTSVSFYIDGTQVANSPVTTNIPVGAGRELTVMIGIYKSAGSTSRTLNMDYVVFDYDLTTSR
jgi:hypothetical protein